MAPAQDNKVSQNGTLPTWLNADFFADVLKKKFGKYEVISFSAEPAFSKGENYTSLMHKVNLEAKLTDGTTKTLGFLTKSTLGADSQVSSEMIGQMSLFPKEMEMYEKVLPQMERLYKDMGIDFQIGAECVKMQKKPPILVMENLKVRNYANINRLEGMTQPEVEAVLEKLAQWHAATARIYELRGPYSDHFNEGMLNPALASMFDAMFEKMWPPMKENILAWGDFEDKIERIENLQRNFVTHVRNAEEVNRLEFNVLNHGDMWCNNILLKHNDDGTVCDVKFVDLQLCRWGSPVQDLQYFLITSCNSDIRISKFDYFVRYYHEQLVRYLKIVKYNREYPTLVELHIQLLKRGFYSYMTTTGVLAVVLLDPSDDANMENFFDEGSAGADFRSAMYRNPRYKKAVKQIFPFLENRGLLDF